MPSANVKTDLRNIADHLPKSASYSDAMYELYVRMRIAAGKKAVATGQVVAHSEVKRRFGK